MKDNVNKIMRVRKHTKETVLVLLESFGALQYLELVDDYPTSSHAQVKYKQCGHVCTRGIADIKKYQERCPSCSRNKYNSENIHDHINTMGKGEYQLISKTYTTDKNYLDIKHLKCGNVFKMKIGAFKSG
jgi:hypothetical protein